ncbi:MAG: hypothetical protein WBF55_14855, partial [Syntrophobacteria bacterium]
PLTASELVMPINLLTTQLLQTQCQATKKAEPETPHFLCFNQDIVVWSQKQKSGLKYVISTPAGPFSTCRIDRVTSSTPSSDLWLFLSPPKVKNIFFAIDVNSEITSP